MKSTETLFSSVGSFPLWLLGPGNGSFLASWLTPNGEPTTRRFDDGAEAENKDAHELGTTSSGGAPLGNTSEGQGSYVQLLEVSQKTVLIAMDSMYGYPNQTGGIRCSVLSEP